MNKQLEIVSFFQAAQLKKIGFNWECPYYYHIDSGMRCEFQSQYYDYNSTENLLSAPTIALALKWFRQIPNQNLHSTSAYECRFMFGIDYELTGVIQDNHTFKSARVCSRGNCSDHNDAEYMMLDKLIDILLDEIQ